MIAQKLRGAVAALGLAMTACLVAGPPAQSASTATDTATKAVDVELNEGRLIKLSSNASSVFIANPEIADVAIKSPRLVYVFGKTPGETTLYAVDRNDRMIASLKIISVFGYAVDAGTLVYPFTFTIRDLVHKLGGKQVARALIIARR